jgi:polyhydroxyalkanoate synthesis regulator phasin
MDAPGNSPSEGEALERIIALLGPRIEDARSLLEDATARWRGDAVRAGEGTRRRVRDLARELGLVTRDEWDDLELRVAQLEHRLRLLED